MIILAHRGFWKSKSERNNMVAFERSFTHKIGIETDIRDYKGKLVISHDIPDEFSITLDCFFGIYKKYGAGLPLALNIKSDGLYQKLGRYIQKYNLENYFVFDMSIPDTVKYVEHNLKVYTRVSEYEKVPSFYKQSEGVWMDEFYEHWINFESISQHVINNKKVCIVSPELHNRSYKKEWSQYKNIEKKLRTELMICTDFPLEAQNFFNE